MRITLIVTLGSATGAYGGPWSAALDQCDLMAARGHEVDLVFGHRVGDQPAQSNPGVNHKTSSVRRWAPLPRFSGLFSLRLALQILRAVRAADVVHVSLAKDLIPIYSVVVCVLLRRPFVVQPHGMLAGDGDAAWSRVLFTSLLRHAHAVLALTQREELGLRRAFGAGLPIVVIGNVIRAESLSSDASRKEVIFMARLHPRKRADLFVQAAARAHRYMPDWTWTIVGPADSHDRHVRSLNMSLGSPCKIEQPVPPGQVCRRLMRADIFVLPAHDEPFGLVMGNALMLGIPVIVSDSAALAPLLEENHCAELFPDGDPEALADTIVRLAHDDAQQRRLTVNGRSLWARYFSEGPYGDRLEEIFIRSASTIA